VVIRFAEQRGASVRKLALKMRELATMMAIALAPTSSTRGVMDVVPTS
jgi:hypothetical protein